MRLSLIEFRKLNDSLNWRLTVDGERVVKASEVCEFLGQDEKSASRKAKQVFPEYSFQSSFGEPVRPSWYLTEAGVLQLYFFSGSESAILLQKFVFDSIPKLLLDVQLHQANKPYRDGMERYINQEQSGAIKTP